MENKKMYAVFGESATFYKTFATSLTAQEEANKLAILPANLGRKIHVLETITIHQTESPKVTVTCV